VPVETDIRRFLEDHPADPGLYSFHVFRNLVMKDTVMSELAIQTRESPLLELTKRLLSMLLKRAGEAGMTVRVVLAQQGSGPHADHRRWALEQVCNDHHVQLEMAPSPLVGSAPGERGEACAQLARRICYEFDFARDPELAAFRSLQTDDLAATDPLQEVMVRIMGDSSWLATIKEKALLNKVPIREMLRRDAHHSLDHYAK
jgi:hypothetical protein